jgi:hypothetical protein
LLVEVRILGGVRKLVRRWEAWSLFEQGYEATY